VAKLELDCMDQDEKSVRPAARAALGCSDDELKLRMKDARPSDTRSWRKEEQLVALAAWLNRQTPPTKTPPAQMTEGIGKKGH
jgi:hypothetical protein